MKLVTKKRSKEKWDGRKGERRSVNEGEKLCL